MIGDYSGFANHSGSENNVFGTSTNNVFGASNNVFGTAAVDLFDGGDNPQKVVPKLRTLVLLYKG